MHKISSPLRNRISWPSGACTSKQFACEPLDIKRCRWTYSICCLGGFFNSSCTLHPPAVWWSNVCLPYSNRRHMLWADGILVSWSITCLDFPWNLSEYCYLFKRRFPRLSTSSFTVYQLILRSFRYWLCNQNGSGASSRKSSTYLG